MNASDLVATDATELAARVRSGEITATELVEMSLARITDIDAAVNAFRVVMADDALADADRIDSLPDEERQGLALAGVPIAIKDDTDVAGQSTMWGTAIDRGVCDTDAEVVRRLRRSGAIIIGKTNVPELTLWPWTESTTWGTTRNPWDLDRTPGGSSGGAAAAVCTGMAAMALGSDGGGSVRYPAAVTGLVGLKPQRGRIPLGDEHASGWYGLITLGPLTRSVLDAGLFLDVASNSKALAPGRGPTNEQPRQLTIAVAVNPPPGSNVSLTPDSRAIISDCCDLLRGLGHTVIDANVDYSRASLWNTTVRFLKGAQHDVASMPDHRQLERRTRSLARLGRLLPNRSLAKAIEDEQPLSATLNDIFDAADIVLTPLCESPAPLLSDCPSRGVLRSLRSANTSAWLIPWNLTGQPAISIPTGVHNGLPTAVQLVAPHHDEATLLDLAAQIEHHQPFPRLTHRPRRP